MRQLAVELEQLGISVHILNPTFHATSMANSGEQIRRTFAVSGRTHDCVSTGVCVRTCVSPW